MRILLLQDVDYLPSYGGGNKANRLLLTELAARGHECTAVCRAPVLRQPAQPRFDGSGLSARGVQVHQADEKRACYRYDDVQVEALNLGTAPMGPSVHEAIDRAMPDWILVSDDRQHSMLEAALQITQNRVVQLVHTHLHLPFGPEARTQNPDQLARMREVRGILSASQYTRTYLRQHGQLDSMLFRFPVYGRGPFSRPSQPKAGYVTLINPCLMKGLPIFIELASEFPDVAFAAVPTWGADDSAIRALTALRNVRLLEPSDDIGQILGRTQVLLAPSLIPETFGYVAVDAMLRGIPVMASDLGGLPEAKLGVDYLLPVSPAVWDGNAHTAPAQDMGPWFRTLRSLLSDLELYELSSRASREAALRFVAGIDVAQVETYLAALS